MWPSRTVDHQRLVAGLRAAASAVTLKGLSDARMVDTLAWQFVASQRREDYYRLLQAKPVSVDRANPHSPLFHAEKAVAFHLRAGAVDEAGWLLFLMTHFGRTAASGWLRLQHVYGRLGQGRWDWASVVSDPQAFYGWLDAHWQDVGGAFGNHRKYESMRPDAHRAVRHAVADYLDWIGPAGHEAHFAAAVRNAGNDPHAIFDRLYRSMGVTSFGRLAIFDYLALIGRYKLAPIAAGSAYLAGATGPIRGARLLVDGDANGSSGLAVLQDRLDALDSHVTVGMTVMEDALCNWQKSPRRFVHFKG